MPYGAIRYVIHVSLFQALCWCWWTRAAAVCLVTPRPNPLSLSTSASSCSCRRQILLESTLKPVHKCKDSREGVTDIKYSPDSRLMAAATADTWIDIYSVVKGYQRVQRCTGHRCEPPPSAIARRVPLTIRSCLAGRRYRAEVARRWGLRGLSLLATFVADLLQVMPPSPHSGFLPPAPRSSTVRGIDWSVDSSIVQSDSADMELLVWNARTGAADGQAAARTAEHLFAIHDLVPVPSVRHGFSRPAV